MQLLYPHIARSAALDDDVTKIQYTTNISSLKSITYCVKYLSRLPLKNHIPGCLTAVIKMYGTTSTVHSISLDEP